jgi:hypothetical protein
MSTSNDDIKEAPGYSVDPPNTETEKAEVEDHLEVFKRGEGQIDFRTVSWIRAGIIFLKSKSSFSDYQGDFESRPIDS